MGLQNLSPLVCDIKGDAYSYDEPIIYNGKGESSRSRIDLVMEAACAGQKLCNMAAGRSAVFWP